MNASEDEGGSFSLYLRVRFWIPPDSTTYLGALLSLSARRMVFLTKHKMPRGGTICFTLCGVGDDTGDGDNETCTRPLHAEVLRIERKGDFYRIEVEPVGKGHFSESPKDRRQHARHAVVLEGRYTRLPGTTSRATRVLDISRGGCCFEASEPLRSMDRVRLQAEPVAGGAMQKSLDAEILVTRCHQLGQHRYEAGGSFVHADVTGG